MAPEQFRSCIDACNACAEACDYCATACLGESDPKPLADCIRLDIDCAEICRLATAYMSRDSAMVANLCRICAEICDACGDECEKHAHMEHCRLCADACRRCADECRQVVMGMAGTGQAQAL
jgi:hypothetical protein